MSIYVKFIDSATPTKAAEPGVRPAQARQCERVLARQEGCLAAGASRRPIPVASAVGAALSSTPLGSSRQQLHYQRLLDPNNERHEQQQASAQTHQTHPKPLGPLQLAQQQQHLHPSKSHQPHHQPHYHHHHLHHHQSSTPEQVYREAPCLSQGAAASSSCFSLDTSGASERQAQPGQQHLHRRQHQRAAPLAPSQWPRRRSSSRSPSIGNQQGPASLFNTSDPVLLEWLRSMRFQSELESLSALGARSLTEDKNAAGALSVRNSQVAIQELRLESDLILNLADRLIGLLPVNFGTIDRLALDFSELWTRLVSQTAAQTCQPKSGAYSSKANNLTIVNCTPRKSLVSARTLRPLDKLAVLIRNECIEMANLINDYQDNYDSFQTIDNGAFEAILRRIKELYGKFVEISVRAECANIVRALDFDFAKAPVEGCQLRAVDSAASLRPVRPYEASPSTLPLKWALIALWQLTKDDAYICKTLTEKWQTGCSSEHWCGEPAAKPTSRVAKRLDYSTSPAERRPDGPKARIPPQFEQIYQKLCPNLRELEQERRAFFERMSDADSENRQSAGASAGALSSALKNKQPVKQVSTIELLIDIIISQPNKHERVDMMNFVQSSKLVDVEELDQTMSAAFYTSNQYKVAALRILNHLCINEQAVKTILRCFSTPPPKQNQPPPENKIIKSVFECYQTAQEHIYQNETVLHGNRTPSRRHRKRMRQFNQKVDLCDEYSDYGSRQTSSVPTSESLGGGDLNDEDDEDDGDDAVVKEATRLLVQLTNPFHSSNQGHDFYTLIGRFSIESLVKYLTNIVKSTSSREMLLISLSALANISFITTEPMKTFDSNRVILEMFRASKIRSKDLELRDQTVTILANTADKNISDIVNNGGLTFLLSCLEICPTRMSNHKLLHARLKSEALDPYSNIDNNYSDTCSLDLGKSNIQNKPRDRKPIQMSEEFIHDLDCVCDNQQQTNMPSMCLSRLTPGELAALERIHQKTAVAFARLSTDSSTTRMVMSYGGVKQLIEMCKLSHRRNHSDTVLIACLAALRKMSKVVGREIFHHYNALDLIELDLKQALEIYGGLYASEV